MKPPASFLCSIRKSGDIKLGIACLKVCQFSASPRDRCPEEIVKKPCAEFVLIGICQMLENQMVA